MARQTPPAPAPDAGQPPTATPAPDAGQPPAATPAPEDRRLLRLGILGAVVAFLGLAALASLCIKPFLPADESANVAYALAVSGGRLPRIDERVPPQLPGQRSVPVNYVANHPPLYYLAAGVPLSLGVDHGNPLLGLHLARLLTGLLSAGAVVLTGVLAAAVARRRRPAQAAGAAALVATSASLILHAGIIHNDGFGASLAAAELVATVLVLRRGLRPVPCLLLVASAVLGLLTRVSAVSLVALSAVALVAAGLLHRPRGWPRALLAAAGWLVGLVAACGLSSGWFYWRNAQLYGDPTARAFITDLIGSKSVERPGLLAAALSPENYWAPALRMFGADGPRGLPIAAVGPTRWAIAAIWLAVAAGLVAAGVRLARSGRRPDLRRHLVEASVAALLALHVVAVLLQLLSHRGMGGYGHVRYLFPAWPVVALVMAAGILGVPGRWGRALLALAVLAQAALAVLWLDAQAARWTGATGPGQVLEAVRRTGVPGPEVVVTVLALLVAAGLGLVLAAVLGLGGRTAPAGAAPRPAGSPRPAGG
jgi:hypothetical protein